MTTLDFLDIGGVPRSGLAAVDATTGLVTDWNPGPTGSLGTVNALAVVGPRVYVGGIFTSMSGLPHTYLAAVGGQAVTAVPPCTVPNGAAARVGPSPFRESVSISFNLPTRTQVALDVFDVAGRRVGGVSAGMLGAGVRTLTWDGIGESGGRGPAGLYFLQVRGPRFAITRPAVRVW